MNIQEAVKEALEENGKIFRSSARKQESDIYAAITPTNSYETCLLTLMRDGKAERTSRCWNPTADDLMADDWTVIKE